MHSIAISPANFHDDLRPGNHDAARDVKHTITTNITPTIDSHAPEEKCIYAY
jgi:hypothetical protein